MKNITFTQTSRDERPVSPLTPANARHGPRPSLRPSRSRLISSHHYHDHNHQSPLTSTGHSSNSCRRRNISIRK